MSSVEPGALLSIGRTSNVCRRRQNFVLAIQFQSEAVLHDSNIHQDGSRQHIVVKVIRGPMTDAIGAWSFIAIVVHRKALQQKLLRAKKKETPRTLLQIIC